MKKFNEEEAKAGKPVCTRDGRDVNIISYERNHKNYPIIALVPHNKFKDDDEIYTYTIDGDHYYQSSSEHARDLFMKAEKKEGWVNIYRMPQYLHGEKYTIHTSEEYALNSVNRDVVATIKIEWEE